MHQRLQQVSAILAAVLLLTVLLYSSVSRSPSPQPVVPTMAVPSPTVVPPARLVIGWEDRSASQDTWHGNVDLQELHTEQTARHLGSASAFTIASDGKMLYSLADQTVHAIDTQTGVEQWKQAVPNSFLPPPGGTHPLMLDPSGVWLYILSRDRNDTARPAWLQILATENGQRVPQTVTLTDCPVPQLAAPHRGASVYILCAGTLDVLDTTTQRISVTLPVTLAGDYQMIAGPDDHHVYVLDASGTLQYLDTATRKATVIRLPPLQAPLSPNGALVLADSGSTLAVIRTLQAPPGTDSASDVLLLDLPAHTVRAQWRTRRPVMALTVPPDAGLVYAAFLAAHPPSQGEWLTDRVVELDATTGRVLREWVYPTADIRQLGLVR